jgi:hypothetical protein
MVFKATSLYIFISWGEDSLACIFSQCTVGVLDLIQYYSGHTNHIWFDSPTNDPADLPSTNYRLQQQLAVLIITRLTDVKVAWTVPHIEV